MFKCLRRTRTNQNFIHEEIKSRLNSWKVWYYSDQSVFMSTLESFMIKM
jgi:hypothetical protein